VVDNEITQFTMENILPTPKPLLEQTSPAMWRGDIHNEEGQLEYEKMLDELKEQYGPY
jgi:hypothetical protein